MPCARHSREDKVQVCIRGRVWLAHRCCVRDFAFDVFTITSKAKLDKYRSKISQKTMTKATFQPTLDTPCVCHVGVSLRASEENSMLEDHTCVTKACFCLPPCVDARVSPGDTATHVTSATTRVWANNVLLPRLHPQQTVLPEVHASVQHHQCLWPGDGKDPSRATYSRPSHAIRTIYVHTSVARLVRMHAALTPLVPCGVVWCGVVCGGVWWLYVVLGMENAKPTTRMSTSAFVPSSVDKSWRR